MSPVPPLEHTAPEDPGQARVLAVRAFNRFYTRHIGLLQEGLLKSPYSLTEMRVLYELGTAAEWSASDLARVLGLDGGYLSRILTKFRKQGLLKKSPSGTDARRSLLHLTPAGIQARADFDARSSADITALLAPLSDEEQQTLVTAMGRIERLLAPASAGEAAAAVPFILRPHRPGDIGWVIQRHGERYTRDYGWSGAFETLVAEIAAQFLRDFEPRKDHCWIAERDGERVGSLVLVRENDTEARLRLLLVEPSARGLGIGRTLVVESLHFAIAAGYRSVVLWTNDVLHSARRIYEGQGFVLESAEPHTRFGPPMNGQTWRLDLDIWRKSRA